MSYESAPATKLLATHCICCGRPLLDSESVELGIGPVCREKHGYLVGIPEDDRTACNVLVHEGAVRAQEGNVKRVLDIATEIEKRGLAKLAGIIRERFIHILITDAADGGVEIRTPYDEAFLSAIYKHIPRGAQRWDKERKVRVVTAAGKRGLLKALAATWPGKQALAPKGVFTIPLSPEEVKS